MTMTIVGGLLWASCYMMRKMFEHKCWFLFILDIIAVGMFSTFEVMYFVTKILPRLVSDTKRLIREHKERKQRKLNKQIEKARKMMEEGK